MDAATMNQLLFRTPHEKSSIEKNSTDIADLIAWANESKTYSRLRDWGIMRGLSGITSIIASCIFIWMIMRSHERLSTTQHRLLLGLCISDIIYSLAMSFFNAMIPSDDDYYVWNARGNEVTCDIQGILMTLGGLGGLYYNCALNLYFLLIVKYSKSDEFISNRIEPFLHGVPIAQALGNGIYLIVKKQLNHDGIGTCGSPVYLPPHCKGYDVGEIRDGFEIPCYRGIEGAFARNIFNLALMFMPVVIMAVSLGMIYRAVRTQEKKLAKYGVGSLRADLNQVPTNNLLHDAQQPPSILGRIRMSLIALSNALKSGSQSCKKRDKRPSGTQRRLSNSRTAVLYKAFGYSFAWFLQWGTTFIAISVFIVTGTYPFFINYMTAITLQLGGFFNLSIFMYPKIMAAKKRSMQTGETISWRQAFVRAFLSRGKGGNKRGGSNKVHPKKSKEFTNMTATSNDDGTPPQEKDKCEIQNPDHLHSFKTNIIGSP